MYLFMYLFIYLCVDLFFYCLFIACYGYSGVQYGQKPVTSYCKETVSDCICWRDYNSQVAR